MSEGTWATFMGMEKWDLLLKMGTAQMWVIAGLCQEGTAGRMGDIQPGYHSPVPSP